MNPLALCQDNKPINPKSFFMPLNLFSAPTPTAQTISDLLCYQFSFSKISCKKNIQYVTFYNLDFFH